MYRSVYGIVLLLGGIFHGVQAAPNLQHNIDSRAQPDRVTPTHGYWCEKGNLVIISGSIRDEKPCGGDNGQCCSTSPDHTKGDCLTCHAVHGCPGNCP
ncbi:hypothetical protein CB0940_08878 [Cercospora beticola]|uniref:Uncharacterized protein n=1 Tax=Cercospora beticola TaxID=122368 RepID=A0A2G5HNZ3_CERBT|nr:hypothetical protein CB0940_08878 [Cercospora beticola]PIA94264.1 hypothetical protein CB0940_08878 [Cercospora beticola]